MWNYFKIDLNSDPDRMLNNLYHKKRNSPYKEVFSIRYTEEVYSYIKAENNSSARYDQISESTRATGLKGIL